MVSWEDAEVGSLLSNARAVRRLDAVIAVWIVVWVVLGVLLWHDIGAQAQLATDVVKVGTAVGDTGRALGVVGGLPLVGGRIGDFADRIEAMGAEVEASGRSSDRAVHRTAAAAGIGVGVLPAVLVLALYLPARLRWRRDVRAVADELGRSPRDPAFEQYLARRAVGSLPWDEVHAVTPDPWGALARGDYHALASAELSRLGLWRQ